MNSKDQIMMNSKQQKKPVVKLEKISVESDEDGIVSPKEVTKLDHQKHQTSPVFKKNVNKQLIPPKGGNLKMKKLITQLALFCVRSRVCRRIVFFHYA